MRPIDIRKLTKRDTVDTDYRLTIDKDNNQCLTKQPDKSLTEDEIKALPVRDAEVTDKRLTLDSANNFVMTNQPDNSAIGTAASKDTGTLPTQVPLNSDLGTSATKDVGTLSGQVPTNGDLGTSSVVNVGTGQDQIETNALKDFKSFDSLTSAIAYVTANPDNIKTLQTASRRSEAECISLVIPYPDGGAADYVVGTSFGTDDGGSIIDAGTKQLKLSPPPVVVASHFSGQYLPAIIYCASQNLIFSAMDIDTDLEIKVPSDFSTLQDAVNSAYTIDTRSGQIINIKIDSGFSPVSGVLTIEGDYSNIKITSADAIVSLAPTFTGDFIKGLNSTMPTLSCLVNAGGYCENGYYAEDGSTGTVTLGAGVTFAGFHGLYANSSSRVVANGTIFTDCSQAAPLYSGILSWGSKIDAYGADVSRSLYYGAQSAATGTLYFRDGIADGCARHNIRATNGAITIARGASAKNGGVSGVRSFDMGMVHATDIDVSGSVTGIWCENSSTVNAENVTGNGCTGNFIYCNDMSKVNANNATATLSVGFNLRVDNSSEVVAVGATLSTTGNSVVRADNGAVVNITSSITSHVGANAMFDIQTSSKVIANGVTSAAAAARLATVFNGSEFQFKGGAATFNTPDGINCSNGSLCNVVGSNILSTDVTGMLFNTLYSRGICYG